jgi:hypothetical protein
MPRILAHADRRRASEPSEGGNSPLSDEPGDSYGVDLGDL